MIATMIMIMIMIVEVGFFIVLAGGSGWRQRMKFVYCGSSTKQNSANIKWLSFAADDDENDSYVHGALILIISLLVALWCHADNMFSGQLQGLGLV